jgi:hypothetical protein
MGFLLDRESVGVEMVLWLLFMKTATPRRSVSAYRGKVMMCQNYQTGANGLRGQDVPREVPSDSLITQP